MTTRHRRAAAMLGVVALLLAACGDDGGATTEADPGSDATDATVSIGDGGELGDILVDADGNTLYIADGESSDSIACTAQCLSAWPPLSVTADEDPTGGTGVDGTLATVTRDDGTVQVTFDGMPLYTFTGDSAPGDVNGHGVSDQLTWHALNPDGPAPLEQGGGGLYGD